MYSPAPDPDLEMGGGGGGGGDWCQKNFFSALRALVWSKNMGARPPGPLPWLRHCSHSSWVTSDEGIQIVIIFRAFSLILMLAQFLATSSNKLSSNLVVLIR